MAANTAIGRDLGQWEDTDPEIRDWFRSLRMPDAPDRSCCGESDGYWCDTIEVIGGRTYCTITDTRDDRPLRRPHIPAGTRIEIPPYKLGSYPGNPTGHAVIFVRQQYDGSFQVFCFVQGTGI